MSNNIPTSPTLPTDEAQVVRSAKDFSGALTLDMTDAEIKKAFEIIASLKEKYQGRWRTMYFDSMEKVANELETFGDEVKTRLAEGVNVLATVDGSPVLAGEPPVIEIIGRIAGDSFEKHGMDHEKKQWEVQRASERDEDYYGQKGITKRKT